MGYYIEVAEPKNKAKQLLDIAEAKATELIDPLVFPHLNEQSVLVCVVKNGPFDAIGIVYNDREFESFVRRDGRPRRWFVLDRAWAIRQCPGVGRML